MKLETTPYKGNATLQIAIILLLCLLLSLWIPLP